MASAPQWICSAKGQRLRRLARVFSAQEHSNSPRRTSPSASNLLYTPTRVATRKQGWAAQQRSKTQLSLAPSMTSVLQCSKHNVIVHGARRTVGSTGTNALARNRYPRAYPSMPRSRTASPAALLASSFGYRLQRLVKEEEVWSELHNTPRSRGESAYLMRFMYSCSETPKTRNTDAVMAVDLRPLNDEV